MKIKVQSGAFSVLEISSMRKSLEQLKQELSRAQAELGVYSKRKSLIEEDYLRSEQEERRKFEDDQNTEKALSRVDFILLTFNLSEQARLRRNEASI